LTKATGDSNLSFEDCYIQFFCLSLSKAYSLYHPVAQSTEIIKVIKVINLIFILIRTYVIYGFFENNCRKQGIVKIL